MTKDLTGTTPNKGDKKQLHDCSPHQGIIIFDGVCYLCDASIHFILRQDKQQYFVFTPLQSQYAQDLMHQYAVAHLVEDTFILIKRGECYLRSDAALEISKSFTGAWRWLHYLKVVPRPIRDFMYSLIAKNRYRIFGRSNSCILPSEPLSKRLRT